MTSTDNPQNTQTYSCYQCFKGLPHDCPVLESMTNPSNPQNRLDSFIDDFVIENRREDLKRLIEAHYAKRERATVDTWVAHTLENVYPLDVFPRTTKEDKDRLNELDGNLHTRAHIDGIYHGMHILRREVYQMSARDDLALLPQETAEYYESKRLSQETVKE